MKIFSNFIKHPLWSSLISAGVIAIFSFIVSYFNLIIELLSEEISIKIYVIIIVFLAFSLLLVVIILGYLKRRILGFNPKDYKLIEAEGGAFIHKFLGTPSHYICPNCFSSEKKSILQETGSMNMKHICNNCKNNYQINKKIPIVLKTR